MSQEQYSGPNMNKMPHSRDQVGFSSSWNNNKQQSNDNNPDASMNERVQDTILPNDVSNF